MALTKSCADKCLCLGTVPEYLPSERVPVPGYCAQVFVWATLKCCVHIGARAQALNLGTKSGCGLKINIYMFV